MGLAYLDIYTVYIYIRLSRNNVGLSEQVIMRVVRIDAVEYDLRPILRHGGRGGCRLRGRFLCLLLVQLVEHLHDLVGLGVHCTVHGLVLLVEFGTAELVQARREDGGRGFVYLCSF